MVIHKGEPEDASSSQRGAADSCAALEACLPLRCWYVPSLLLLAMAVER